MNQHVLHILNGLTGGAAESTLTIIHALNKRGIKSSIYVMNRGVSDIPDKISKAVENRVEKGPLYLWVKNRGSFFKKILAEGYYLTSTGFLYHSTNKIMAFAQKVGVTTISSSTSVSPDGAIAAMRLGLPHIWHIRELYGNEYQFNPKTFWSNGFNDALVKSGYVINNSVFTQYALSLNNENSVVVGNAIDFDELVTLRESFNFDNQDSIVNFGIIASSASWKRHDLIIKAASFLKNKNTKFRLLLIGFDINNDSNEYIDSLVALVDEYQLHEQVIFRGKVSNSYKAFKDIDVLVHAATAESFGRIYFEAFAAGRPVIAADSIAPRQIIEHGKNGFLVSPNNPAEIADYMYLLLDQEQLKIMSECASKRIDENFSAEKLISEMMAHYNEAIDVKTSKHSFLSAIKRLKNI